MKYLEKKPAVLVLEDGTVYPGKSAGKIGTATGEICFNTGMTGYQEIFTDPSYFGQIMVTTNVHIGNYGVRYEESESEGMKINALVCRNFTNLYSRKQADESIQNYFLANNLVCISEVDTRALVLHIRDKGAMNAIISSEILDIELLKAKLKKVPSMEGLELSSEVSTKEPYFLGNEKSKRKVAVLDLGVKKNILRHLAMRDCYLKIFPAKTSFEEMDKWQPDGYFISNGPGDPAAMDYAIKTVKKILDNDRPMFGICLGHQLFACAMGIPTFKMHNGHRGINHPVKNVVTGKCEITSQNHGFGVVPDAIKLASEVTITHVNLNDQTIEGMHHNSKNAFTVQYHPETSPGPHDSEYLFDQFVSLMQGQKVQEFET
ncbi:MAG: glutamine-hydrolyzing carbamoyl-phosphate synthase small subunit [Bacteroidia bacterium]